MKLSGDGRRGIIHAKLFYITDGSILHFEYHHHDRDSAPPPSMPCNSDMPPPPRKVKAKIDDAWSNMDNEKKYLVVFAVCIMKGECNHNPDRPDAKNLFKYDGNWMKPGGMITCPRIGSSMIVRLLD